MKKKCEKCGNLVEFTPAEAAAELGSKGGKKSRSSLTPERQAKMQAGRKKAREKSGNDLA